MTTNKIPIIKFSRIEKLSIKEYKNIDVKRKTIEKIILNNDVKEKSIKKASIK